MTMLEETRAYIRPDQVSVRRRRVMLALAALAAATVLVAIATGSAMGWAGLVSILLLAGLYGLAVRKSDRQAVEKEFGRWESELADFGFFDADLAGIRDASPRTEEPAGVVVGIGGRKAMGNVVDVTRFIVCNAAGWLLAPLVFALTILVGRTPKDTTGQRWLANLRSTQIRLEEGSKRTVALAATTASVTAVSTAVVLGGATAASASQVTTHSTASVATATASSGSTPVGNYTVVAGDTLGSIAARFATTYETLAALNNISDPNLIYPGQVLRITTAPQPAATTGSPTAAGTDAAVVDAQLAISVPAGQTSQGQAASTPSQIAVKVALDQVGKPYVWAGAGPADFDCSGLVMYAWEAAGVSLPHYSVSQFYDTTPISESELEPGDLVFYNNGNGPQPGHVTMYVGNGQVVAADYPGTDVRVESLTHDGTPMAFGRVK